MHSANIKIKTVKYIDYDDFGKDREWFRHWLLSCEDNFSSLVAETNSILWRYFRENDTCVFSAIVLFFVDIIFCILSLSLRP
jgi:hypothetical protein